MMNFLTMDAASLAIKTAGQLFKSLGSASGAVSNQQDFSTVLQGELAQSPAKTGNASSAVSLEQQADQEASRYMRLLDVDASGSLSRSESGLSDKAFAALDLDGNGELSAAELRQAVLARLNRSSDQAMSKG